MATRIYHRIFLLSVLLIYIGCSSSEKELSTKQLKIISYNIWNAFEDDPKLENKGIEWIQKQQPDVLALQELVGITKEKLKKWAQRWGHSHVAILKEGGYPTGLTSRWPIENVERRLEGMHHGYLYGETGGLAFGVLHLSPFSYKKRGREVSIILSHINSRAADDIPTVILGDFNAVSPYDSLEYKKYQLKESVKETDDQYEHVENLKKGELDYGVLKAFYDNGWVDLTDIFDGETVTFSYPSKVFAPIADNQKQRIDYILSNKVFSARVDTTYIDTTISLSDHYPVIAEFICKEYK